MGGEIGRGARPAHPHGARNHAAPPPPDEPDSARPGSQLKSMPLDPMRAHVAPDQLTRIVPGVCAPS